MFGFLKLLSCLFPVLFVSCSLFVAGTTEETNALAGNDPEDSISSAVEVVEGSSSSIKQEISSSSVGDTPTMSSIVAESSSTIVEPAGASSSSGKSSSSVSVPDTSTTVITDPVSEVMRSRYWHQFCNEDPNVYVNVKVDVDEGDEISVSYEIPMPLGGGSASHPEMAGFGIAIRVAGDGPDVFSEMKTWTGGACYMVSSDAPVTLKIGMSPEKEAELEYDLPQATLIGPAEVGSMVIRCLSWLDFEQQGFGPEISIEDAFFNEMTELRFEVHPEEDDYKGELRIYQIRAGGTGISANTDGMNISVDDGTENIEQPDGN